MAYGSNYFGQAYFGQGYAVTLNSAIAWDASSNSGYKASLSTYSWSHILGAWQSNPGLLVNVSIFATGTVTSVTWGGVNLEFERADQTGVYRNEWWQLSAPLNGTRTIVVTLNTSLTSIASADSYTGVNQTDMVETATGATGSISTAPTASVTTVDDKSWVVSGLTTSDATMSVAGGATQRNNQTGALGTGAVSDSGVITPVGSVTMSWSTVGVSDSWVLGLIVLDPTTGTVYSMGLAAVYKGAAILTKATARTLPSASYKTSGVLTAAESVQVFFTATYSMAGVITKRVVVRLLPLATYSASGVLTKLSSITPFAAIYKGAGTIIKKPGKTLTATYSATGAITKRIVAKLLPAATYKGTGAITKRGLAYKFYGSMLLNPIAGLSFDGYQNYGAMPASVAANNLANFGSWSFIATIQLSYDPLQSSCILYLQMDYTNGKGLAFEINSFSTPAHLTVYGMVHAGGSSSTGVVPYGQQSTVGVTWDGTNLNFYINGVNTNTVSSGVASVAGVSGTNLLGTESTSTNLGANGGRHFHGIIQDVRTYSNRVLSGAEITSYASGTNPTNTNMALGFNLVGGSGTTTADLSGNSATATLTGTPLPTWITGNNSLTKQTNIPLSASYSTVGVLISRGVARVLTATYSMAGVLTGRSFTRVLIATYSATGAIKRLISRNLSATYKGSGVISKTTKRNLSSTYRSSGVLTKNSVITLFTATYITSTSFIKRPAKIFTGTYKTSGFLSWVFINILLRPLLFVLTIPSPIQLALKVYDAITVAFSQPSPITVPVNSSPALELSVSVPAGIVASSTIPVPIVLPLTVPDPIIFSFTG